MIEFWRNIVNLLLDDRSGDDDVSVEGVDENDIAVDCEERPRKRARLA